jgi:hypothetical protein
VLISSSSWVFLWYNKLYPAVRLMNFISALFSPKSLCFNVPISQRHRSDGTAKILYTSSRGCLWTKFGFKTLSNSMEQSPYWEANTQSASQEIPRLLWKPKVHNLVLKIEKKSMLTVSHNLSDLQILLFDEVQKWSWTVWWECPAAVKSFYSLTLIGPHSLPLTMQSLLLGPNYIHVVYLR